MRSAHQMRSAQKVLLITVGLVALNIGVVLAAPATPSGLAATPASASQVNLTWIDNSTNPGNSEAGFKVERGTTSTGPWTLIATTGANVTTNSATGLSASTTHYFRVYAFDSNAVSSYSNVASATTAAALPTAAPSNLTATAVSTSQINVTWTDNSTN